MAVVRALFTGSITPTVTIIENEIWAADDPIVVAYPQHFSTDLDPGARRTTPAPAPVVEEATAEPGTRRRTTARTSTR